MPTYDHETADVFIYAQRESDTVLASMGHDLKIAVEEFTIDVDWDAGEVSAEFAAESLTPVDSIKWESREETGEMSAGDRHEISQRISNEVLAVDEFPTIGFDSTSVESTDEGWHVTGTLALHGDEHEVEFDVERRQEEGVAFAEVTFDHTEWGVEQYSAMLGSLKVSPELTVTVRLPIEE